MSAPETSGELNYALTMLVHGYVERMGGLTYTAINDVIGALENCKLEFYRRKVVPFENTKLAVNGDV